MTRVALALLTAVVALSVACGGAGARSGSLRPLLDVDSSADRERLRAALVTLRGMVGHPVDFAIDQALIEGTGKENLVLAELVEGFIGLLVRYDPTSSESCRPITACTAYYQLDVAIDTRRMLAQVRAVELRYDALGRDREPRYDLAPGRLVFALGPDWSPSIRWEGAKGAIVRATLGAQFAGRSAPAIGPGELAAYVWAQASDPDEARSVIELAAVYPRLTEPGRTVARDKLVHVVFSTQSPATNAPAVRDAWASWYRAFAASLPADDLRRASGNVFVPLETHMMAVAPPEELGGLPAFDYAWSLFERQLHGSPNDESRVLTCAEPHPCETPLYRYFTDRGGLRRRQRLVQALIAARDVALTRYVLARLFNQRAGHDVRDEILQDMEGDPAQYGAALTGAMLASATPGGDGLVATWDQAPTLRAAILRAAAAAGQDAGSFDGREAGSIVGAVRNALESMARSLCNGPRAQEFAEQFRAAIPPASPVFIGDQTAATSRDGVCSGFRRD